MIGRYLAAEIDDPDGFEALAAAVRDWEPQLDLSVPPRQARLFEPDGTCYGIALADGMAVVWNRRTVPLGRGDAIVVPQGVALDVEPELHILAIRDEGPAPDHFRERFIQVWGFEHRAAPRERQDAPAEVIGHDDVRFRISYAIWDLPCASRDVLRSGLDVVLLVGLDGEPALGLPGEGARVVVAAGTVAAVGPGLEYRMEGRGRLGLLILRAEPAQQARRLDAGGPPSPEYPPGPR
jgi:hypothetical protein